MGRIVHRAASYILQDNLQGHLGMTNIIAFIALPSAWQVLAKCIRRHSWPRPGSRQEMRWNVEQSLRVEPIIVGRRGRDSKAREVYEGRRSDGRNDPIGHLRTMSCMCSLPVGAFAGWRGLQHRTGIPTDWTWKQWLWRWSCRLRPEE